MKVDHEYFEEKYEDIQEIPEIPEIDDVMYFRLRVQKIKKLNDENVNSVKKSS